MFHMNESIQVYLDSIHHIYVVVYIQLYYAPTHPFQTTVISHGPHLTGFRSLTNDLNIFNRLRMKCVCVCLCLCI